MRPSHDTETFRGVVPLPQLWIGWPTRNAKECNVLAQEVIAILENFLFQDQRPSLGSRPVCGNDQIECVF